MKSTFAIFLLSLVGAREMAAQGHPIDWPLYAGDAQRTGWEKTDSRITRENVKDFQEVLKQKLDNKASGPHALSAPVVIGMLISYRGFKELAFVAGSSDNLWALDADLERGFWQQHFDGGKAKGACSGAATPALNPPTNFSARKTGRPAAPPAPAPEAKPATEPPLFLRASGFGSARPVFTLTSDGKVHLLNTSNGEDMAPALQFIPPGARASSLTFADSYLYTTTSGKCGGVPDAVWAIDLGGATPPAHFAPPTGGLPELGGVALGTDGDTVYTRTKDGSVLGLTAKDLKPVQQYTAVESAAHRKTVNSPTPLVFTYKDRDVIVSASEDGRLLLLDSQAMATPLFQTEPITTGGQIWGGLASYQDADGTRWVYAPVWGPVSTSAGTASDGAIVALKLEERDGKPMLTPVWVSEDMSSPEPPVLTGGMVFALAAGKYTPDERPKGSHATLYAFDAATGKEMYSTKDQVTAPASLSGVTLANARIYFTTVDNMLWAFGVYLER